MSSYEQVLSVARSAAVSVPGFAGVAEASERERQRWADEGRDVRARARRWLWLGAVGWLSWGVIEAIEFNLGWRWILYSTLSCLVAPLCMAWGARLSLDPRLRPAILVRAIAASNLMLALLISLTSPPYFAKTAWLSVLAIAVGSGRALQLLGERGLDGSEDPDSPFEPVKFRGVLILALIMASTDALMLVYSASLTGVGAAVAYFTGGYGQWIPLLPNLGLTALAALVMAVNVWGLLRLRTWALLTNMISNIGVAALALGGMLSTATLTAGPFIAVALVSTAGIQLLLPLPILATALGLGPARSYARVAPLLLRVVVPAAVLATAAAVLVHVW